MPVYQVSNIFLSPARIVEGIVMGLADMRSDADQLVLAVSVSLYVPDDIAELVEEAARRNEIELFQLEDGDDPG